MSIIDWIAGAVLLVFILVWTAGFIWDVLVPLPVVAYRHLRYTRKGVCYQCKRKFAGFVAQPVDQMYSSRVLIPVCTCTDTKYLPMGNRHFAEW